MLAVYLGVAAMLAVMTPAGCGGEERVADRRPERTSTIHLVPSESTFLLEWGPQSPDSDSIYVYVTRKPIKPNWWEYDADGMHEMVRLPADVVVGDSLIVGNGVGIMVLETEPHHVTYRVTVWLP